MKKLLVTLFLVSFLGASFGLNPLKVMKKIDRKTKRLDNCKCLSKVLEIDGNSVKFYYAKKRSLVKIIERRTVGGATVFRYFYFDKKTNEIISVNLVGTIFYYYGSDYFAIISRDNYSDKEAEKKGTYLKNVANKYLQEVK